METQQHKERSEPFIFLCEEVRKSRYKYSEWQRVQLMVVSRKPIQRMHRVSRQQIWNRTQPIDIRHNSRESNQRPLSGAQGRSAVGDNPSRQEMCDWAQRFFPIPTTDGRTVPAGLLWRPQCLCALRDRSGKHWLVVRPLPLRNRPMDKPARTFLSDVRVRQAVCRVPQRFP
jgi:hypothetical protein